MTPRRVFAPTLVLLAAALSAWSAPPTISPASLTPSIITINQAYTSADLTAVPAPPSVCSWSFSGGTAPPGLGIAPAIGNPEAGAITGTPTKAGKFTFTVTCTTVAGPYASANYTLFVSLGALSITQTSVPAGSQNTAYNFQLTPTGGVPPFTWSFGAGSNSDGLGLCPQDGALSCSPGGLLFGKPTAPGTFPLNPVVTDAAGQQATAAFMLVVASGSLSIQTSSLGPAAVGVGYSQTLAGSGGTAPYVWTVSAGSLPAGLTLDAAAGTISGTPTAGGIPAFTITLTDAASVQATASLTINVLGITTTSLPNGVIGTAYSQTLQVAGGVPPITWAVSKGTLPPGLTLSTSTGTITGTPTAATAAGGSTFTVSASYTPVSVASAPSPVTTQAQFTIFTGTLSVATPGLTVTQGVAFKQVLGVVTGGTAPLAWAIVTGTLPVGLMLDPVTGIVSGTTLAAAGSTSITFTVTDSLKLVAQATVTITVNAPPPPTSAAISGLPTSSGPFQQQLAVVSISGKYPLDINGTLTLSFASAVGGDDQMVCFSSGSPVVNGSSHTCTTQFTIPAGSTQASFGFGGTPNVTVITGTVAGTITITAQLTDSAMNNVTPTPAPTTTMVINPTVPFISSVTFTNPAPGELSIAVKGFSSTRDMVSGLFHFTSTTGTTLTSADVTVQLGSAFTTWYTNTASNVFGSEFTLTIPFTYQSTAIPVATVTVTLTSSKGASNPSAPATLGP